MYGYELLIIGLATLGQAITGPSSAVRMTGLLVFWRILMGIGIVRCAEQFFDQPLTVPWIISSCCPQGRIADSPSLTGWRLSSCKHHHFRIRLH
jgi:hypothetical protein